MKTQEYRNHVRVVPAFHYFLVPLSIVTLITAVLYAMFPVGRDSMLLPSILLLALSLAVFIGAFFTRQFATKVQDRAIRAEESLRHFALTGKLLDSRLEMRQIIALRFAADEEFPGLCEKAIKENLSPDEIKRSIKNWRADDHRV